MSKKILIIEDEDSLRQMFVSMLKGEGFEVESAENGEVGLQKIKEFKPDLIMLDIMMPVMDGYGVLKNLQSEDEEEHIPVIVLTGLDEKKEEDLARFLGADDFLRKDNIHLEGIIEKINNIFNRKKE